LSRDHGKAFDLKAFANGFGEAFDIRGFARGLCSAFDLRNAAKLFVAGFRDGADLIRRQLHGATALVRLDGRDRHVDGLLLLQRLLADMAGGGGAAAKALREIRYLMRPYNPRVDAIPDGQLPSLVKRIIDDLQKPAARAEDFTGAVGRALAEAQAKAAELAFAEAAQVLDAALAQTGAEDQERARGRAALLAERGWIARLQLRYREAAEFYEQAAKAVAFDALTAWEYVLEAAGAYYAQGDEFGDNGALIEAIALYRSALKGASRVRVPLQWAMVQNNLGNALGMLGDRESGTTRLEEAVKAFRGALKEYTRERVPFDWAMTLNNLGNALLALGERERGTTRLKEAVAASHAALTEWRRERAPLDWAGTQNNLGIALTRLGEREPGTARLEFAVAAYRAALTEWTRERVPLRWATTQNNLGATLETLGERESGMARRARLEGAITSYNDALALFVKGGAERQAGMCRANRDRVLQLLQAE